MRARHAERLDADWWRSASTDDGERTTSVLGNVTQWDLADYTQLRRDTIGFEAAQRRLARFAVTGAALMADTFQSLFKAMPEVCDVDRVRIDHLVNRAVIIALHGMVEYKDLHGYTAGDGVAAALATLTLVPTLEELLDEEKARQQEADALQQRLADLRAALAALTGLQETLGRWEATQDGEGPSVFPQQEDLEVAEDTVAALEAECAAMAAALAAGLDGDTPGIAATLQAAVAAAADAARGYGPCDTWGVERGHLMRMSAPERLALAKKINSPRMRRIADLFGQIRSIMWAEQSRKTTTAEHWVVDVELGGDLPRVLPQELARMVDPDQEDLFLVDLLTESLPQWRLEGSDRVGKGRIIFCGDGSSSMRGNAGPVGGARELWAKAVMLCLLHLARQQHREFTYLHFGSQYELWQKDFNTPADYTSDAIFEAAETFHNGGTNFATPLEAAVKSLEEERRRTGRITGDIVFATDGHAPLSPQFIAWFKERQRDLGFQVYGICIGGDVLAEPLQTVTDGKVCTVADLVSGGDIRKMFRAI